MLDVSMVSGNGHEDRVSLAENALRVLRARYLKKDEQGNLLETPGELFRRVAGAVARAEENYHDDPDVRGEWEDRFFELMAQGRFMPNSPTLMNAGREMGMLSACFVLPVKDSIQDIFSAIHWTALIQKAGGGTGFAFDELRPTGDYIQSSGGMTSGPIAFWRVFNETTEAIQQGAFRRGANMGMMYIHHPDILKFLHAKEDLTRFVNYNISVKIPDAWMEAFGADADRPHVVINPRTGRRFLLPKDLDIDAYTIRSLVPIDDSEAEFPEGEYYTRRDLWTLIVRNAWRTGEPGVVFIDRINEANPTPRVGRIEATNPCGEQPLLPFEACNLGSVNLAYFVDPAGGVDWNGLKTTVHEATRFLDDVIDVNRYPLPEIEAVCKANRKIGLGVMGFADALFKLGAAYNSEEGVEWGRRFMEFVNDESHNYGETLARERGSFPNWRGSIYDTVHHRPMRNATTTTVAPTGTISIIASCSGGIEPLYSLAFIRNVLKGQDEGLRPMIEVNAIFEEAAKRYEGFYDEELLERLATDGTLKPLEDAPEELKRVFVCAHDVSPKWHMRMQAAFQEHCDASISKTINFPESAAPEDVEEIYRLAYALRCKGVTVYRNGCRAGQPMALKTSDEVHRRSRNGAASERNGSPSHESPRLQTATNGAETTSEAAAPREPLKPATLPEICSGLRMRQITPFGNMHINVTVDPTSGKELEVFAQLGKGGDLANSDLEAICRMVSLWLRSGGDLDQVIRQLHGIGSTLQVHTKEGRIMSLADGLARALLRYTDAKARYGIHGLLLGEFNLNDLRAASNGKPHASADGSNGAPSHDSASRNGSKERVASNAWTTVRSAGHGLVGEHQWQQEKYKVVCPHCQVVLRFMEGCVKCEACGYAHC